MLVRKGVVESVGKSIGEFISDVFPLGDYPTGGMVAAHQHINDEKAERKPHLHIVLKTVDSEG